MNRQNGLFSYVCGIYIYIYQISGGKSISLLATSRRSPIGVIAMDFPTWMWYVGALSSVKWMISGKGLPGRMEGCPSWISKEDGLESLEDVEIMLVQGEWNIIDSKLWNMDSVKIVLKVSTQAGISS